MLGRCGEMAGVLGPHTSRKGVGCRERPQLQLLYPQDPTAPAAPPASQLLVLEENGSQIQPDDGCFISFSQGPQFQGVQSGQSMGQEGGQSQRRPWVGGGQGSQPAPWTTVIYPTPASAAPAPGLLSGILVLSQAGVCVGWPPTCPRTLCTSQGCLQGGACDSPHSCTWLCTSQSPFTPLFPQILRG